MGNKVGKGQAGAAPEGTVFASIIEGNATGAATSGAGAAASPDSVVIDPALVGASTKPLSIDDFELLKVRQRWCL